MALTASVIICTRNRRDDIITCLISLANQTYTLKELIVVDSSDIPLERCDSFLNIFRKSFFPSTELIYLHTMPGLTYQRNQGIQKTKGDITYFFDDDVILLPTYVTEMQLIFEYHSQFVGGMGDIHNINKRVSWRYRWFRRFFLLPYEGGSGNFSVSGLPIHPYGTSTFKAVEVLGGCCMAFRTSVFKQFLFDEALQGYCYLEDADIARRVSMHNKLFYNPRAQLMHNESPIARGRSIEMSTMFAYNYSYLFFKNFYPYHRIKIIAYIWSIVGLCIQALLVKNVLQCKGILIGLKLFYTSKRQRKGS